MDRFTSTPSFHRKHPIMASVLFLAGLVLVAWVIIYFVTRQVVEPAAVKESAALQKRADTVKGFSATLDPFKPHNLVWVSSSDSNKPPGMFLGSYETLNNCVQASLILHERADVQAYCLPTATIKTP